MDSEKTPYVAIYEAAQSRSERIIKKLILALIIVTAMLFASNIVWIQKWTEYDYASEESIVTVSNKNGNANYIGNDGDIVNGQSNR